MKVFLAFLFLFSLVGFVVFLIKTIVSLFTKKKLKKNFIRFFICFFLTIFSIIMMPPVEKDESQIQSDVSSQPSQEDDESQSDISDTENTTEPEPVVDELTEEEKEDILKLDEAIWSRIIHAEECYNVLLGEMESSDSLYSIYELCGDIEDQMDSHISEIGKISDKRAKEYTDCAGIYCNQIRMIASNIRKYINKQDMKYLEKAQDAMLIIGQLVEDTVSARFAFLSACGFSNDEIIEISESGNS